MSSPPIDIASGDDTEFLTVGDDLDTTIAVRRDGFVNGGVPVLTQFGFTVTENWDTFTFGAAGIVSFGSLAISFTERMNVLVLFLSLSVSICTRSISFFSLDVRVRSVVDTQSRRLPAECGGVCPQKPCPT